ncbi:PREDICTED: wall-associated receptor kinase-like 10 [Camelina sativa]|uniref:Wall-associated receptor kinase-like 10 n=1 Tax=Camelina sativa TaxID=90675 RepID=A0ABM0SXP6_CAMSA|nr:PREDICTED: wall-associated receptor kinase-like 10 [Camelina sativa]
MSSSKSCSLLILFSMLLLLIFDSAALTSLEYCKNYCGEIEIPYPFGIEKGCYLDKGYEIECKTVSGEEIPFLSVSSKEVVEISLPRQYYDMSVSHASLHIKSPVTSSNKQAFGLLLNSTGQRNSQWLHAKQYASLEVEWSFRTTNASLITSLGCSQNKLQYTGEVLSSQNTSCTCHNKTDFGIIYASCWCTEGYRGNPYLLDGCKDINECKEYNSEGDPIYCGGYPCENSKGGHRCHYYRFGLASLNIFGVLLIVVGVLMLLGGCVWLYMFIRRRKRINRKKNFFRRNGGLLLQQQLTSTEDTVERTKVFTSRELEKATENFSENRVLGQGGQGTVYKGMLVDGSIVAVKKSTVVDEDKLGEFINEVVILSHINHRNIVKLLGCCLETEVPLLVYEFISNGNLFEHLHDESSDYTMATWEVRLRMAIEIAGALSYLHSAASAPIYHRDIKSTNIMLDEKYRVKVSDFGTSRTVTEDHTHLTTLVSGTAGYLDPKYFQSSQFTDKSDVYSFGVVLVELITGEKPISFTRPQENRTLATYFNISVKENKVVDIIDARIRDDCKLEQVMAVAQVARRCLNLKRKKRPSMRQVSMELEMIRSSPRDMQPLVYVSENEEDQKEEEALELKIRVASGKNVNFTAPASQHNVAASSSSWSDVEPLFSCQTRKTPTSQMTV